MTDEMLGVGMPRGEPQQARLVLLLDVSGSMNLYSLSLLRLAHRLEKHFPSAET